MNSLANCLRCGALPCTCGWQEPADEHPSPRLAWVHLVVGAGALAGLAALLVASAVWLLPEQPRPGGPRGVAPASLEITPPTLARTVAPVRDQPSPKRASPEQAPPALQDIPAEEAVPVKAASVEHVAPPKPREVVKERKESASSRNRYAEQELLTFLAGAEEVSIGLEGRQLAQTWLQNLRQNGLPIDPTRVADCGHLFKVRPDLATLPLRDGPATILSERAAKELDTLSRKLRIYLNTVAPPGIDGEPRDMNLLRTRMRMDLRGKKPEWLRAAAVPALNQLLMGADTPTRALLVELLAAIPERAATVALAQRAVFDVAPEVRAAATDALKGRDPEAWRPTMLKGLSYPWPPPADFAAEALTRLRDVGAVPDLVVLLKQPRPGRPVTLPNKSVVIQEVVKLDHLRSCQVCHPPALRGDEPILGTDPIWNVNGSNRDPTLGAAQSQFQQLLSASGTGSHDYAPTSLGVPPLLIRGDITFLRQDFAVSFPVVAQRPPAVQRLLQDAPAVGRALGLAPPPVRFDYVVRTRRISKAEQEKWQAFGDDSNPQRDAVLFALRELTGQDHGPTTEAWVRAFPGAEPDVRAGKLAQRLVRAEDLARLGMLQTYQAGEGAEYTHGLARAIPRLAGLAKESARLALTNRLAKLPADELRAALADRDAEVRRAAARVCGQRQEHELVPDLVPLLDEDATRPQAREALKRLTGVDLPDGGSWRKWLAGASLAGE